ncbi:DNA repair protein RadC [Dissulfurirhabdus thermomarina]|uniref:DNA repair protein RadC n=1 Tax=Dissulfurirhabdus thermomarina TaxID=1765737 RepID=A0A6N9TR72_DISTH|nr:DNA repair protein RadC [Dissulfurirhabdus thermomarina]NDY42603.1 DNA repair protein RadC [Dissulfurirhabdus thermomarina]NMX22652.1 DNA repair protein RadC [Dissulfurirhabdus thermomarina]
MDKKDWQRRGAGHRERLRERFLENGLGAFTDAEILEVLFGFGTPRQDCKDRARAALARFGSLPAVLEAAPEELRRVPGVGPKNVFALRFVHAVARKFLERRIEGKTYVHAAADVAAYLGHALADRKRERFLALFLDARHAILGVETLFEGTLTASAVYPREVVKAALARHAAALVFAHNHPSGNTDPSPEDIRLTRNLYLAARLLDIRVLDHLVVGEAGRFTSFAEAGLMADIRAACEEMLARAMPAG